MPELPEVETVRRGLAPHMQGQTIQSVEQRRMDLRFSFPDRFAARLQGKKILSLSRRAKYLLVDLEDMTTLIMHLGMSGSFRVEGAARTTQPGAFFYHRSKLLTHDHVVFHMADGVKIIYNDPRRFGFMDLVARIALQECKHFRHMGVEPTGNALSAQYLARVFTSKRVSLKAALLDQRLVAGLGNIYVCEALWRAELSPRRRAASLVKKNGTPTKRLEGLARHIRAVINEAIEAGGSSLRDYRQTDGSLGYFQHNFAAYNREHKACKKPHCTGIISRINQNGRSTFYCPSCQR